MAQLGIPLMLIVGLLGTAGPARPGSTPGDGRWGLGEPGVVGGRDTRTPCNYAFIKPTQSWSDTYYTLEGHTEDDATHVKVDADGNAYVTAMSMSEWDSYNIVTIKYGLEGHRVWSAPAEFDLDQHYDQPTGQALDESRDALYVSGYSDHLVVVIRYRASTGEAVWASTYPANSTGSEWSPGMPIGLDAAGDVYVCADCDWGARCLVLKYSGATGMLVWDRFYDNPGGRGILRGLTVSGNAVYAAGGSLEQGEDWDVVTIKYDLEGNLLWVRTFDGGSNEADDGYALAADDTGAYVAGTSALPGTGVDGLVLKYSPDGLLAWIRRSNGSANQDDYLYDIALDGRGSVYACGGVDNNTTGMDYLLVKYSADGSPLWARTYTGGGTMNDGAMDLELDGSGAPYVTGGEMEDPGVDNNIVTLKYTENGWQQWLARFDAPGSSVDLGWALAVDRCGCAWVAGSVDTNPSSGWNDFDALTVSYCWPIRRGLEEESGQSASEAPALLPGTLVVRENPIQEGSPVSSVFTLPSSGPVSLLVLDASGRRVATLVDRVLEGGSHEIAWNGRDTAGRRVQAGTYFLRLMASGGVRSSRLVVVR